MVKYKDTASKVTPGSRSITIEGVHIEGTHLMDEDGDITAALASALPEGVEEFTIKIKLGLPEEDEG